MMNYRIKKYFLTISFIFIFSAMGLATPINGFETNMNNTFLLSAPLLESINIDSFGLFSADMWRLILGGLQTTAIIFVFASITAILLGIILAYLAISHKCPWLFKPLNWFVTTVHDIPSVALMMLFYYVIFAGEMNGIVVSIIALGVYTSGSLSKLFKIHILQVGKGQIEAGRVLGMTTPQCYKYIVLPQAVKSMLPLFIAELKIQLRATSYAGYISQNDLIKAVFAVQKQYDDTFIPLIIASIFYLILSWMITQLIQFLCVKIFKYD